MFRFCLLISGVAFLEKLDTRQKTAHFKAKNIHFNWIACTILRLKMSTDIVPLKLNSYVSSQTCGAYFLVVALKLNFQTFESLLQMFFFLKTFKEPVSIRCQFHQHFTYKFFVRTLFFYVHVTRKSCQNTTFFEKFVRLSWWNWLQQYVSFCRCKSTKVDLMGQKTNNQNYLCSNRV